MSKEIYEWLFYLLENHLTPEAGDHYAKIRSPKTKTIEDIANRIVKERTEYRKDTIINILNIINDVKLEFLAQGNSINDGITLYEPTITGVFEGETVFDEKKNSCIVNVHTTKEVREMLANVRPSYTGLTVDNGGAVIEKVVDSSSGSVNEMITPGKVITITGKKIRVVAEESMEPQYCVSFVNEEGSEEYFLEDPIITNDPSKVVVQVPPIPSGSYRLVIKTLYSTTSTTLKAPRHIAFKIKLVVM